MRPEAFLTPSNPTMLKTDALRVGLLHASLAARSKWPDALPGGRPMEWNVVQGDFDQVEPDVWVLGTSGTVKQRLASFASIQTGGPLDIPILVLLNPREDQAPWLSLDADGYHEISSSAALMAQRIGAILPSPETKTRQDVPSSRNLLAMDEAARWQATFNAAGAGILTGRTSRFFDALPTLGKKTSTASSEALLELSRGLLRSIDWELNNQQAAALLELREPIALDSGFIDRLTPLHGGQFLSDVMSLGQGTFQSQSEWICRNPNGNRYLSLEITVPNSLEDCLFVTLLDISERMRLEQELRDHVQTLEDRVEERTRDLQVVNQRLNAEATQRQRLAQQVRESLVHITQGVITAKQILEVALPGKAKLKSIFSKSMVIERPRDILGGDFLHVQGNGTFDTLALVDSTGHGIPGAMVSLMGHTLLQEAISSTPDQSPKRILEVFHAAFVERMKSQSEDPQMYGFDAGIVTFERSTGVLRFAGAKEDLYLVRDGECIIHRGSRCSIELATFAGVRSRCPEFEESTIPLRSGDQIYLNTDGVRDQFGGPNNRKLGRKRFADILVRHAALPLKERKKAIQKDLLLWKGANAKVDDATLVGFDV